MKGAVLSLPERRVGPAAASATYDGSFGTSVPRFFLVAIDLAAVALAFFAAYMLAPSVKALTLHASWFARWATILAADAAGELRSPREMAWVLFVMAACVVFGLQAMAAYRPLANQARTEVGVDRHPGADRWSRHHRDVPVRAPEPDLEPDVHLPVHGPGDRRAERVPPRASLVPGAAHRIRLLRAPRGPRGLAPRGGSDRGIPRAHHHAGPLPGARVPGNASAAGSAAGAAHRAAPRHGPGARRSARPQSDPRSDRDPGSRRRRVAARDDRDLRLLPRHAPAGAGSAALRQSQGSAVRLPRRSAAAPRDRAASARLRVGRALRQAAARHPHLGRAARRAAAALCGHRHRHQADDPAACRCSIAGRSSASRDAASPATSFRRWSPTRRRGGRS